MGQFDGILLCTDLDGTLLRNDKSISAENLDAIRQFQADGGLFSFVTGRMPLFVSDLYEIVRPNAPIGCINGGGVYDFACGKYLQRQELSRDVLTLVEYADHAFPNLGIQVNTFDVSYSCRENDAMADYRAATGLPNISCDYWDVPSPIAKIVFADRDDAKLSCLAERLQKHARAGEFCFIRSEKTLYEILPAGVHKGVSLRYLAHFLGIDLQNTVAIGDYDNDVEMLRTAGVGVAVANATDKAKMAADVVTVSNEEHAIAHVIAALADGALPLPV